MNINQYEAASIKLHLYYTDIASACQNMPYFDRLLKHYLVPMPHYQYYDLFILLYDDRD